MIVVDTNVIIYLMLPNSQSENAELLLKKDSDWQVPVLWRSEFRNVLAGYFRAGKLSKSDMKSLMQTVENIFSGREHQVDSSLVMELVSRSACSAYDCEFAALATKLDCQLVTADKGILRDFPDLALSLANAVA